MTVARPHEETDRLQARATGTENDIAESRVARNITDAVKNAETVAGQIWQTGKEFYGLATSV